jgi:aspartyl/asparaginyl-tRNA synthetase
MTRLRHHVLSAAHATMTTAGYWQVTPPILTSCDAEGAGDKFNVTTANTKDFFGPRTSVRLTVSAQLYLEAPCSGLSSVCEYWHY